MSKDKDDFEESFGDSNFGKQDSDFSFDDENEFDVSEDDVELSSFPDASDLEDDFKFNSGEETIDVDDSDEFELDESEEVNDEFDEDEVEFEEEDQEFEVDGDGVNQEEKPKKNIAKYAFYAGTVAIIGVIGYVGVTMFAPNLLGGGDSYDAPIQVAQPVVSPQPNTLEQTQNAGLPSGISTPPVPQPGVNTNIAQPGQIPGVMDNPRPGLLGGQSVEPQNNNTFGLNLEQPPAEDPVVTSKLAKDVDDIKLLVDDISVAIGAVLNKVDSLNDTFVSRNELQQIISAEVSEKIANSMPQVDLSLTASKSDLDSLSMTVSSEIEQLQTAFNQALVALEEKTEEIENSSTLVQNTESQISALEEKFSSFESEITSLQSVIDSQKTEIASLEQVVESQKSEITKTRQTVQSVSRAQRQEIDSRRAIGGGINPPTKPRVLSNYRLAGVAKDMAWIETESGVSRIRIGQNIPGVGLIEGIRPVNGNWAVVTPAGLIMP